MAPCGAMGPPSCEGAASSFSSGRFLSPLCLPRDFMSFFDVSIPISFLQLAPAGSSFCLLLHRLSRGKAFPGLRAVLCSLFHFPSVHPSGHSSSLQSCALPTPHVLLWAIWGALCPLLFSVAPSFVG